MSSIFLEILQICESALLYTFYTVGILYAAGLIIWGLAKISQRNQTLVIWTGLIGTPVHEFSHALMCVLFRHRIVDICFYQKPDATGTMGYVNHAYNQMSLYQQIGNYFIGVAPLLGGTAAIYLLMMLLLPGASTAFLSILSANLNGVPSVSLFYTTFGQMVSAIFEQAGHPVLFILFLFLSMCIAAHMRLSPEDIKGSIPGVITIFLVFILIAVVANTIPGFPLSALNAGMLRYNMILALCLILAVVLAFCNAILNGIVNLF